MRDDDEQAPAGRGDHEGGARSPVGIIAGVLAIAILVTGAAAALLVGTNGPESSGQRPAGADQASDTARPTASDQASDQASDTAADAAADAPPPSATSGPGRSARRACRAQEAAAGVLVSAARTGIAHLKVHVGAHEAWRAGDLDEQTKDARYRATRLAGPGDLRRYADAEAAYQDAADTADDACARTARRCARRLRALEGSMAAAEPAMAHWEEHLANMADFAAGKFDADRANTLWDRTRVGLAGATRAWGASERTLERAPRCSG